MPAATGSGDAASLLRATYSSFDAELAALSVDWSDSAALAGIAHARVVSEGLSATTQAAEAHAAVQDLLDKLVALAQEQCVRIDEHLEEAGRQAEQAQAELQEADDAANESLQHARSAHRDITEALRVAGRAGQACGKEQGFGMLEGLVQQRVMATRKRSVLVQAGKEAGKMVTGELVGRVLDIPDEAVPPGALDHLTTAVEHAWLMRRGYAQGFLERWRR